MKDAIFYIKQIMAMGLSQKDIEKQTDIKQATVSYLLSGHLSPDVKVSTLEALKKIYFKLKPIETAKRLGILPEPGEAMPRTLALELRFIKFAEEIRADAFEDFAAYVDEVGDEHTWQLVDGIRNIDEQQRKEQ